MDARQKVLARSIIKKTIRYLLDVTGDVLDLYLDLGVSDTIIPVVHAATAPPSVPIEVKATPPIEDKNVLPTPVKVVTTFQDIKKKLNQPVV